MNHSCEGWMRYFPADKYNENLYKEFEMRATNVSTEVFRTQNEDESAEIVLKILNEAQAIKIATVDCPLIKKSGLIEKMKSKGYEVYTTKEEIAEHIAVADVGISGVEFGIAECGSVCQDAYSIESRLVSSLPPLHIALLNSAYIVPGVEDALDIISKTFDRGYVSWITGPSRTADIERVLTIGVHGPSRFVIIATNDKGAGGVE